MHESLALSVESRSYYFGVKDGLSVNIICLINALHVYEQVDAYQSIT